MLNRIICRRLAGFVLPLLAMGLLGGCAGVPSTDGLSGIRFPGRGHDLRLDNATFERGGSKSLAGALAKGRAFEKAGQWEKAREVYEPLIVESPRRFEPFHRLGVVADCQRRHREAQALFTRALQLNPRDAQTHNDLGYCFYLQGKLAKAESSLLKATQLDPINSRYWNNLGMVFGHQGRLDEAMEVFRQGGSEADAQFNLAFVLASQDRIDEAKERFRCALAIDPNHEKARNALASFEQYENAPERAYGPDTVATADGRYVPYVEPADASGGAVQQASHVEEGTSPTGGVVQAAIPMPRNAGKFIRALHNRARELRENPAGRK